MGFACLSAAGWSAKPLKRCAYGSKRTWDFDIFKSMVLGIEADLPIRAQTK